MPEYSAISDCAEVGPAFAPAIGAMWKDAVNNNIVTLVLYSFFEVNAPIKNATAVLVAKWSLFFVVPRILALTISRLRTSGRDMVQEQLRRTCTLSLSRMIANAPQSLVAWSVAETELLTRLGSLRDQAGYQKFNENLSAADGADAGPHQLLGATAEQALLCAPPARSACPPACFANSWRGIG